MQEEGSEHNRMTRSKQTTRTKPVIAEAEVEQPPAPIPLPHTDAPALHLADSDTPAAPAVASASSLERLMQLYSTDHMPDTHEMELQDGTRIRYKLLKGASAIAGIEARAALVQRLCQNKDRVEKEWPELLPFLPLDYFLLRDAVTLQDCLLPPFAFTLPQAVQLGKACGSLISDIASEIRRMSEPTMWPKPAQTATQDTPQEAQDTQEAAQPMQEAA